MRCARRSAAARFDAVAVELDPPRLQALTDPDALAKLDLVKVIRTGKTALFAANLALAAYQRRLAEQLGIEPGAELKRAVLEARERDLPVHLIDREVGLTFKRASHKLGWWGRAKLGGGLLAALFVDEEVGDDDIEKLKQGDMLESSFSEFASDSPELYETRDRRARPLHGRAPARDRMASAREVLAVVGAGHLQGLARHLREEARDPAAIREELESLPKKSDIPVVHDRAGGVRARRLRLGLLARRPGCRLRPAAAVGAVRPACSARSAAPSPAAIRSASSPLSSPRRSRRCIRRWRRARSARWSRPGCASRPMPTSWRCATTCGTMRGWWRNRVARVLLNFFLTSLGTAIGVWTGGAADAGQAARLIRRHVPRTRSA